MASLR